MDVAPDWRHPVTGQDVTALIAALHGAEQSMRPLA